MPKVLYVEDNPDHAELVLETLQDKSDLEVHHVRDGAAALAFLRDGSVAPPRLILLDLRLPKVDGLAVIEAVRGDPALKRIPVVVLTTSTSPSDLERAYAIGVNAYLVKPTDLDRFEALLDDVERFWLSWNRIPEG